MKRKIILNIIAIIIPAIFLIILLIIIVIEYIFNNSYYIFPNPRYHYKISFFSDQLWGGKSQIKDKKITDENIYYVYNLDDWGDYAIAGMNIDLTDYDGFFDMSKYKYLNIKLTSSGISTYRIFLLTFIDGKSKKSNASTLRHHRHNIFSEKSYIEQSFKLNLNEFHIPEWWISSNKYEGELKLNKFSKKVVFFQIQNYDYVLNKDFSLDIKEIKLTKGFPYFYVILSVILFLYLAVFLLYNFYLKNILQTKQIIKIRKKHKTMTKMIKELELYTKKLESLSLKDELTGLYNRRGLKMIEKHQYELAKKNNSNFILLFIDLDKLKEINDTHGHYEGDFVIKSAADILKIIFKENDVLARFGGDEFVVLSLYQVNFSILKKKIDTELKKINNKVKKPYDISLSYGGIEYRDNKNLSFEELISLADMKLYSSKRNKKIKMKKI